MNDVWESIDSGCFAVDSSTPPEEEFRCTVVIVTPTKQKARVTLNDQDHDQGDDTLMDCTPTGSINQSQLKGYESLTWHRHQARPPPVPVAFRRHSQKNQPLGPKKAPIRQLHRSSFLPPRSLLDLLSSDGDSPQSPRATMSEVSTSDDTSKTSCYPRQDASTRFSKNVPDHMLIPNL